MNKIAKPDLILSVCLSTNGKQVPYSSYFSTQLHSLVHQNLSEEQRREWQVDLERIENYLHGFLDRSNVRSLVFLTSGKKFWQVMDFEFSLPPSCRILSKSYLKPFEEIVDKYQKYLVLLVDRKKARLFTVHLGKIEEHKDIFGADVPQNVKAKKIDYGREDKIFRHIEIHLHRHLQNIALVAKNFAKGKNIHFIIIGGHAEIIPKMKKHLRYPLKQKVLGQFVTELNIPLNEVFLHSKKVATEINEKLKSLSF